MYAILDIETTGGKYNEEGITEIAIHVFDGHKVVDRFISLVNPEREIQPFVVNLTGINNTMLRSAPKFHEVAKRIVQITENTVLVAHNAQFDYRILRTEFKRLGYEFERKTLCTVDLAKHLLPDAESYSLGKLVRSLGIPVSDRHRANGDALATLGLFKILLNKDSGKEIIKGTVRNESEGELTENQLRIVEKLPNAVGVYYMHNKDGEIIYLAKSQDLKKRVNQHFTNNSPEGRKLQKETKKVTFELTGNGLAAELKEYFETRRNRPKYRNKTRKRLFSHGLLVRSTTHGYLGLSIEPVTGGGAYVATFNSAQGGENFIDKITQEHSLYPQINSLSKEEAHRIPENTDEYNERVQKALDSHSVSQKNVVLLDKGRDVGEHCAFLIKDGKFRGFGYCGLNHQLNNIHILESIIVPMDGDSNAKHIIETYLRKRNGIKKMMLIP
ncbi:MAG: exonuclease domain-containing protein [Flavobacteriaceae bacterium]